MLSRSIKDGTGRDHKEVQSWQLELCQQAAVLSRDDKVDSVCWIINGQSNVFTTSNASDSKAGKRAAHLPVATDDVVRVPVRRHPCGRHARPNDSAECLQSVRAA